MKKNTYTSIKNIIKSNKTLLLLLIVFNFLNVLDKVTTYIGIKSRFFETNMTMVSWFGSIGLIQTLVMQLVIISSISVLLYLIATKLLPTIKQITLIPLSYLNLNYLLAVISNTRWLI